VPSTKKAKSSSHGSVRVPLLPSAGQRTCWTIVRITSVKMAGELVHPKLRTGVEKYSMPSSVSMAKVK